MNDKPMTVDALMENTRLAWYLGQRYWQQADSESYADNKRSALTLEKFNKLLESSRAAIEQYGKEQYARGVNDAWPKHKNGWTPVYGKWGGNDSFRCNTCDAEFTSAYAAAAHCATEHPQDIEQVVPATAFEPLTDEQIARLFHDAYKRLAPTFLYCDSRTLDPESPNDKLMIAVLREVAHNTRSAG